MTTKLTLRDHALAQAAKGFRVFPLRANAKVPIWDDWQIDQGPRAATCNLDTVRRWWTDALGGSADYNIGINTTGMLVADPDCKKGKPGLDNWSLHEMLMPMPDHPKAITPTGGEHHFFRLPEGVSVRNIADSVKSPSPVGAGIDVRSWHGYVVAAGSIIDGVEYRWANEPASVAEIPEAPSWLVAMCKRVEPKPDAAGQQAVSQLDDPSNMARATCYLQGDAPEAVEGGGGDSTTYSVAVHVRDYGVSQKACLELMLDHWNERCSPPWSPEDLEVKVANAYRYAQEPIGSATAEADFAGVPLPQDNDFLDALTKAVNDNATDDGPLDWIDVGKWKGRPAEPQKWLVKDWVLTGYVTLLYGDGGLGKSLLAQQLATAVVTNTKWLGMDVGTPGRVAGLLCEDAPNILHGRQNDICAEFTPYPDEEQFYLLARVGLDNTLCVFDQQHKMSLTPFAKRFLKGLEEFKPKLLILDTAADVFGGNENVRMEVRRFLGFLTGLAQSLDMAVLICAHPSRDGISTGRGDSGSTAWNGGARSRLYLTRGDDKDDSDARVLTNMKSNYAKAGGGLEMHWRDGFFALDSDPLAGFADDDDARQARVDGVVFDLLAKLFNAQQKVSLAQNSPNAAWKLMAAHPDNKGLSKDVFHKTIIRLHAGGRLQRAKAWKNDKREWVETIIAVPAAK